MVYMPLIRIDSNEIKDLKTTLSNINLYTNSTFDAEQIRQEIKRIISLRKQGESIKKQILEIRDLKDFVYKDQTYGKWINKNFDRGELLWKQCDIATATKHYEMLKFLFLVTQTAHNKIDFSKNNFNIGKKRL